MGFRKHHDSWTKAIHRPVPCQVQLATFDGRLSNRGVYHPGSVLWFPKKESLEVLWGANTQPDVERGETKKTHMLILEKWVWLCLCCSFGLIGPWENRKLLIGNILYFFRSALTKSKREKNARRASGKLQPKTNMDTQNNHIWNEIHFKNHDFWFLSQIWGYSDSFSITMSIPSQNCLNACSMLFPTTIRLGPLQFIEKVAISTPQTTSTAATEWSIRIFAIRDQNWMFESIHIWLGGCQNHATAGK